MKRFCPHCGSEKFKAIVKKASAITINEKGEMVLLKEGPKTVFEVFACVSCNEKITNEDLVETKGTPCTACKKLVSQDELIDGKCTVCNAKETREDIANASPEDLIKKILELEKLTKAKAETKKEVPAKKEATKKEVKEEVSKAKDKPESEEAAPEVEPLDGQMSIDNVEEYSIENIPTDEELAPF